MSDLRIEDQIIFLYCSDLDTTAAFYEDLLGFPLVVDQGSCRITRVAGRGGGFLGYCERLEQGEKRTGVILTFVVSSQNDVDDWYEYLSERGVVIDDVPHLNPTYKIYHFFFDDPDGYKLEIQSFQDPGWSNPL
jgi:catechol 2,3-dioxygenase-like lactoylglutathione lyase family enzyme